MVLLTLSDPQGATLQMLVAFGSTPTRGTVIPSAGTANVWPTPLAEYESYTEIGLPLSTSTLPSTPWIRPHCWLRRGLPESNCLTVTLIRVCAWTIYVTQVGCAPYPIEPTVWTVRLTGVPAGCADVKSTTPDCGRRKVATEETTR